MTVAETARRAISRERHITVEGTQCVYCGANVRPVYDRRTGRTRGLDHFVPVSILAEVRRWHPAQTSTNWLLPCCRHCNGSILGDKLFMTFLDKFEFAYWRIGGLWRISDNAAVGRLAKIEAPEAVKTAVASFDASSAGGRIVEVPKRLDNGAWRKVRFRLCKPQTHFMAPFAMVSSPSVGSIAGSALNTGTLP